MPNCMESLCALGNTKDLDIKKVGDFGCKYQKTLTLLGLNSTGLYHLRSQKSAVRAIARQGRPACQLCFSDLSSGSFPSQR